MPGRFGKPLVDWSRYTRVGVGQVEASRKRVEVGWGEACRAVEDVGRVRVSHDIVYSQFAISLR